MFFKIIGATIGIIGIITPFAIFHRNKRNNTIKEFKDFFLSERHKITTTRGIQDFDGQDIAIRKLDGIISANDITTIRNLWKDYKKAENQCRQAVSPGNGSTYIHYCVHKPKILSKIDKIINHLK